MQSGRASPDAFAQSHLSWQAVLKWMPPRTWDSALSRVAWDRIVKERVIPAKGGPLVTVKRDLVGRLWPPVAATSRRSFPRGEFTRRAPPRGRSP
jgi:hypothetical protein